MTRARGCWRNSDHELPDGYSREQCADLPNAVLYGDNLVISTWTTYCWYECVMASRRKLSLSLSKKDSPVPRSWAKSGSEYLLCLLDSISTVGTCSSPDAKVKGKHFVIGHVLLSSNWSFRQPCCTVLGGELTVGISTGDSYIAKLSGTRDCGYVDL